MHRLIVFFHLGRRHSRHFKLNNSRSSSIRHFNFKKEIQKHFLLRVFYNCILILQIFCIGIFINTFRIFMSILITFKLQNQAAKLNSEILNCYKKRWRILAFLIYFFDTSTSNKRTFLWFSDLCFYTILNQNKILYHNQK